MEQTSVSFLCYELSRGHIHSGAIPWDVVWGGGQEIQIQSGGCGAAEIGFFWYGWAFK